MIKSSDYNHKLYEIAREGKFGNWELKKESFSKDDILPLYNSKEGYIYTEKIVEDCYEVELADKLGAVMTDSEFEQDTYRLAVEKAHGRVLVCGLGLGLFNILVEAKIKSGVITQLDVVEEDPGLIDWVPGYLPMLNTDIIEDDAWEYLKTTSKKYDLIFIDIWSPVAQALVEGSKISKIAERCLTAGGEVRYWLQELGVKLSKRRNGHAVNEDSFCHMCGRDSLISRVSNLYGILCMECADEYESFLYEDDEVHANGRLSETLQSLGYKILKPKLSEYDIADIVVEGAGKKYLVECKTHLTSSAMFKEMERKIFSYSPYKNEYSGLKLLVYGNAKPELVLKLGKFIQFQGLADWVEILFGGEPVM